MASTTAATESSYPSPVTPPESESEPTPLQSTAMPTKVVARGRKRSASDMSDHTDSKPKHKQNYNTARKSVTSHPRTHKPQPPRVPKPQVKPEVKKEEKTPRHYKNTVFEVECPVRPAAKQYIARTQREDLDTARDAPLHPEAKTLQVDYAVKPGREWAMQSRFKNAKFKEPFEIIYSAGQIVYVNRHDPVPPAPDPDASDDEKLDYDRKNLWVGLISEFRAETQENVYVRLFWLYWPEELPMGRQPYHGKRELVMSNHCDIIEAPTIASHADISFWDENDDSNKTVLSERFWRQKYDLTKVGNGGQAALSKLRKFCICGGYDNPEVDMYQCHKAGCGMWNHEACLVTDLEDRAWEKFQKNELTHEVEHTDEPKSLTGKIAETFGNMIEVGLSKVVDPEMIAVDASKAKKPYTGKKPWLGKLEGEITKQTSSMDEVQHRAVVRQLVKVADGKRKASFKPLIWNMELKCLRCQQPLN